MQTKIHSSFNFGVFVSFVLLPILLLLCTACSKETDNESPNQQKFDRSAFLVFTADSIIIPSYMAAISDAQNLQTGINELANNPSAATQAQLSALRTQWQNLAMKAQPLGAFDFGPGLLATGSLSQEIHTFPIDTARIGQYIRAGDTTLNNFYKDTRGLYTLEYLLFHFNENDHKTNSNVARYLKAVSQHYSRNLSSVLQDWQSRYRSVFIERNGTDAGSSTALYFNAQLSHFEMLKNFKFALPMGLRAGQSGIAPTLVEAYYSGQSMALAQAHFDAVENLWRGRTASGRDGLGFDDYLRSTPQGEALVANTQAQMQAIQSAFRAVPQQALSTLIQQSNPEIVKVHTELSKLTRFIKSDQASLLGISITYSSGDGD